MTTTDLIKLLEQIELGASGRPREISISIGHKWLARPYISIESTGDGIAGAEVTLLIE